MDKESATLDLEYERRYLRKQNIISITGDIGSGTSRYFIEDVHMVLSGNNKSPIKIIISSPGGDAFSGLAIIRTIGLAQRNGFQVIGEVHGYACSMAFFILECCDERCMGKLDILMAHGITTGFVGDMRNMEAENKLLSYWHGELANLIAARCIGECHEPGYWYEILRDNTPQWYTAEECLLMGLIDRVEE